MDFSKDLTEFPSMVHNTIYSSAREIIPLQHSLSTIKDAKLKESCEAFYRFVMDMLSDMYDDPEAYELPVYAMENFLGKEKLNGMKQKFPSKTKNILSQTRNSVERYYGLFSRLGYFGEVKDEKLIFPNEEYPALKKEINTSSSPISLERRLQALTRIGLNQTEEGFQSERYPNMFLAMCALAKPTKGKMSGFPYYNFSKLDFRNIEKNYKPNYIDNYEPLTTERRNAAYEIHNIADSLKCKPTISTFLKVDYKYKGAQVMLIDSAQGNLYVRITEAYVWNDQSLINTRLEKESEELKKQAQRHLWRCTACSTTHLGQFVELLGHRNRVCGGGLIGFNWYNPTSEDVKVIKRFLQMRTEIIDEIHE